MYILVRVIALGLFGAHAFRTKSVSLAENLKAKAHARLH